jgi:hypothetical protein
VRCSVNSYFDDVFNFLEGVDPNGDGKYRRPHRPHKSLECVDLCGIGGVGGLIALIEYQIVKEKGSLLAFLRCRCKTVHAQTGPSVRLFTQ